MTNTLPAVSEGRQPRGLIKVNGVIMTGWTTWETDENSFYAADTFRATFSVSGLPSGYGADWWASQARLEIEIFAGFPKSETYTAADLDSVFFGRIDDLDFDVSGFTISVTGRDLTSELIDTKTSQKYPNLTAAQIATKLATAHGLTPVVTATSNKAGRYYQIDHVQMQDERTEWDLLTWLAKQEQFIVYVRGKELHFEPRATTGAAYTFQWEPGAVAQFNGTALSFQRSLTLAKDITVKVRSWNAKNKKGFERKAQAKRTKNRLTRGGGASSTPTQEYSYNVAGLTPDQAQQFAEAKLKELSAHEMKLTARGPADNALHITNTILAKGTGTAFDQTYYPDSIIREMDVSGYTWTVNAKNHSPESEPLA